MQKIGIIERKTLILLSLTILTLILTTTLATPTLAKKDKEKNVEFKVVGITVDGKGKVWVTVEIYVNGVLKATVTFDPPGGGPGFPDE
jgi:hypothetical protein